MKNRQNFLTVPLICWVFLGTVCGVDAQTCSPTITFDEGGYTRGDLVTVHIVFHGADSLNPTLGCAFDLRVPDGWGDNWQTVASITNTQGPTIIGPDFNENTDKVSVGWFPDMGSYSVKTNDVISFDLSVPVDFEGEAIFNLETARWNGENVHFITNNLYEAGQPVVILDAPSEEWITNSSYSVTGEVSNATGDLLVTNSVNGQFDTFTSFASPFISLSPGQNELVVTATNANGSASDSIWIGYATSANDFDGDGMSDLDEWIAGAGITDPNSFFQIENLTMTSSNSVLSWISVLHRDYTVLYHTNLLEIMTPEQWILSSFTNVPGTGGTLFYTNTAPQDPQIYRVRVRKP